MALSPKLSMWLNILVAVMAAIVGGTIKFTGIVSDPVSHSIIQWSGFLLSIVTVANAAMHAISSQGEGPLTNMRIKLEKIAPKGLAMIMGFVLCISLITTMPVSKAAITPHVLNNDIVDVPLDLSSVDASPIVQVIPASKSSGETISFPAILPTAFKDVLAGVEKITVEDLQSASIVASNSGDVIAAQCYQALVMFIQKTNSLNIDPVTNKPVAVGDVHLITDFQMAKVFASELLPTSQTSVQCAPFANANGIISLANLLKNLAAGAIAIK
jgi:hypothetical protein